MEEATPIQKQNREKYMTGLRVYDILTSNPDVQYIICAIGIGDTINIASLVSAYKKYYNINKVVLVVQKAHEWVAGAFPEVDGTYVIPMLEIQCMQAFMYMSGLYNEKNVLYGHYRLNRRLMKGETGEVRRICDENLTYIDTYKQDILGIPLDSKPTSMVINKDNSDEFAIYDDAVLIVPYASTFRMLPERFWEALTDAFVNKGIPVYTNCKDETEPPIKGTKPFYLSLQNLVSISHRFKNIIALRCGICDALIFADCRLNILYPYHLTTHEDGYTMDDKDVFCDVRNLHDREGIQNLICHDGNETILIDMLVNQ